MINASTRSLQIPVSSQMTVLLYLKDHIKTKLYADEVTLHVQIIYLIYAQFDEENRTNEEEILQEAMIDQVYLRAVRKPKEDPAGEEEGKAVVDGVTIVNIQFSNDY